MENTPHIYVKSRSEWRDWLVKNHETEQAVWLVYDKGAGRTLSWEDIVQEALCFGWIDSRPGKVSDTQSKLYICKRKPKSVWSKINKQHIAKLIESGSMAPAGLKAVEVAKANGSWDALNLSDNLVKPPELISAFKDNPAAAKNFEAFSESSRRNTLQWIYDAKTAATKLRRVQEVVAAAVQNQRLR